MPTPRRRITRRRLRRVKQTGGAMVTSLPIWRTHMEPAFAAPRVFFIAGDEDMKYTDDTIVSDDTMDYIGTNWSELTQTFCPLEIEVGHALLRFRGPEDEDDVYGYERVVALCVSPDGKVEGFALIHLNEAEDGIETDILCAGREGEVSEERRTMIENILKKAITAYDAEAFEDNADADAEEEEDTDEDTDDDDTDED